MTIPITSDQQQKGKNVNYLNAGGWSRGKRMGRDGKEEIGRAGQTIVFYIDPATPKQWRKF